MFLIQNIFQNSLLSSRKRLLLLSRPGRCQLAFGRGKRETQPRSVAIGNDRLNTNILHTNWLLFIKII